MKKLIKENKYYKIKKTTSYIKDVEYKEKGV